MAINKVSGSVASRSTKYYCGLGENTTARRITYGKQGRTVKSTKKELARKKICVTYSKKKTLATACSGCGTPACLTTLDLCEKKEKELQAVYLMPVATTTTTVLQ